MIQNGIHFPKTHDLLELHKLCTEVNPGFELIGDHLDRLNPFAVEFRYPGEEVSIEEAKTAVKIITEVRQFIRNTIHGLLH